MNRRYAAASFATALMLAGCDDRSISRSDAELVGTAQTCSLQRLNPDHAVRVVRYGQGELHPHAYVVSLSNGLGVWWPVAVYEGWFAPKAVRDPGGAIAIEIVAKQAQTLREPLSSDSFGYRVTVHDQASHPDGHWRKRYAPLRCDDDGSKRRKGYLSG